MSGRLSALLVYALIVYHNLNVVDSARSGSGGSGGNTGQPNTRIEKLEAEVAELTDQVKDLAEKVEIIAIDRWCEKTIGCYFDIASGTLTYSDIPGQTVIYTGVPNELRSKVTTLNVIALTVDPDFLVSNLDGLENLQTITLTAINWVGENFTTVRAFLPKLTKFSITSAKFAQDTSYLQDEKLKNILFFDKTNATSNSNLNLDEIHKLGVDINVHGQFILEHSTGILTSYKRSIETLINNIESDNTDFVLKYLYLSNYNLTANTKLPTTIEYLGLNSVQFLGSRNNLVSLIKQLRNLQVLDIIAFPTQPIKLDLNTFSGSNSINTLKFGGSIELILSNSKLQLKSIETIRWFNININTKVLGSFVTTFSNVENVFLLTEDKSIQYPFLKAVLQTNVKNIMMPEFNFDVDSPQFNEMESTFNSAGIDTNDLHLAMTKFEDGHWEKGSRFNFWKE